MINAAIKKWTQSGESRGNKCTASNNGQSQRVTNGETASISPFALRERKKKRPILQNQVTSQVNTTVRTVLNLL